MQDSFMLTTSQSEKGVSQQTTSTATVMICIDAFSQTYLSKEDTPFMHDMASNGVRTVIDPLFAFRGIETTMFTGVWPEVHGTWTEICLRQDRAAAYNSLAKLMVRFLDFVASDKIRKIGRIAIQRLVERSSIRLTPNLIPAEAVEYFESSQKRAIFESGSASAIPTIFDLLREKDVKFAFIEPPILTGDRGVVSKVANLAKSEEDIKLWYLKFGKPDKVGHEFGPHPQHFNTILRQTDSYVREVIGILEERYGELNIMILADHGMSSVTRHHDLLLDLKSLKAELYKDYIVFLDSTMARFWFLDEESRIEVRTLLNSLDFGHVLSNEEMKKLHIPLQRRYGDLIFAVGEGKMIYPDFWSGTRKAKGMHGYAFPSSDESLPILIANKQLSSICKCDGLMTYLDVFSILRNSLSV